MNDLIKVSFGERCQNIPPYDKTTEKNSVLRSKKKKAVRVPFFRASFDIPPLCSISFPFSHLIYLYINIFRSSKEQRFS